MQAELGSLQARSRVPDWLSPNDTERPGFPLRSMGRFEKPKGSVTRFQWLRVEF